MKEISSQNLFHLDFNQHRIMNKGNIKPNLSRRESILRSVVIEEKNRDL